MAGFRSCVLRFGSGCLLKVPGTALRSAYLPVSFTVLLWAHDAPHRSASAIGRARKCRPGGLLGFVQFLMCGLPNELTVSFLRVGHRSHS